MKVFCLLLLLTTAACNRPPTFAQQGYFFISAPDEELARRENPQIMEAVAKIVLAITEENPQALLEYVHKQEGAIIDAKAVTTYAQVATALHDRNSQLYRVLWDDRYWKDTAPKENIRSYRKTSL